MPIEDMNDVLWQRDWWREKAEERKRVATRLEAKAARQDRHIRRLEEALRLCAPVIRAVNTEERVLLVAPCHTLDCAHRAAENALVKGAMCDD